MPPMCMYCAEEDGMVTPWHVIHYTTRAMGGVGLIIIEATGIAKEGRISSGDLGLWTDEQIPGMAQLVSEVHKAGAKIGIQLNHAGRKCEANVPEIKAPSAIPFQQGSRTPREMTKADIQDTIVEFKAAAERAEKAGFDWLEIHGAHGYLINEFLSPLTNLRTDEYGGTPENRVRFLGEVLDAVATVWPKHKVLEVRITAEDYLPDGNRAKDLAEMLNLVKNKGIDIVNVSTGGVVPVMPKVYPGYQIIHAEIIKQSTSLPVVGGGMFSNAEEMKEIMDNQKIDLIYLGRELLRNPYWPLLTAMEFGIDVQWPKQYERAKVRKK